MEHVNVLVIGAGLSGIGAGCHLTMHCPNKSFTIVERREAIGGTWDIFRYPGIRSDSDMYTFGYSFRPWTEGQDIASAESIRNYLNETIDEYGIREKIRLQHAVNQLGWSSEHKRWTAKITRIDTNESFEISADFLLSCTGYYSYDKPHRPTFVGSENFKGQVIHPQFWPQDLDYKGKQVVVIGSGATAMTLVPALAKDAGQVTLLQRSPTYVFSRPGIDPMVGKLRRWLSAKLTWRLMRTKYLLLGTYFYWLCRKQPDRVRAYLRKLTADGVGPEVDVDQHFKPKYNPWDERLCVIPDNDLYDALRNKSAQIVTDEIKRFTEDGIELASGQQLPADIIVTATGLTIEFLGGISATKDGVAINTHDLVTYRGMMFGNIPNFVAVFGYANASWTLKADLTCTTFCRMLNHMDKHQFQTAIPAYKPGDTDLKPLLGLSSSYVKRARAVMPSQGDAVPWRNYDYYLQDYLSLRLGGFRHPKLIFE